MSASKKRWNKESKNAIKMGSWVPISEELAMKQYLTPRITGDNIDLCCGFRPYVKSAAGVDISSTALKAMEANARSWQIGYGQLVEFDLNELGKQQLPFKDGRFDSATMVCGWNYIDDKKALVEEVERIVKPGGEFYVMEFIFTPSTEWHEIGVTEEKPFQIEHRFRTMGYESRLEAVCMDAEAVIAAMPKAGRQL